MVVLAIGAHPDDLELNCFGTLAKFVKQGHTVYTCTVCNGSLGSYVIEPGELAEMRKKEAAEAAEMIGAKYVCMDIGDTAANAADVQQQVKMVSLIRDIQPDLIITHAPNDYMGDHVETHKLVFKASFDASVPHYEAPNMNPVSVCPIYFMENAYGVDFLPQDYVDITDEIDVKEKALGCHKSQVDWLRDHDNFDLLRYVRLSGEYRGVQCGAKFAEGFRKLDVSLRVNTKRMIP